MPRTELFRGGGYVIEETDAHQRPGAQPSGSLLLISSPDGDWCRPAQDYAPIRALLSRLREVEAERDRMLDCILRLREIPYNDSLYSETLDELMEMGGPLPDDEEAADAV